MSRRLVATACLLWVVTISAPAWAHPAGLPPLAEISYVGPSVRTALSVAMDDTILMLTTAGAAERDPTGPDGDRLATQPEAAAYLTSRYVLSVPEGPCAAEVVGGRPLPGQGFRFLIDHTCPAPVGEELSVRNELLRDLSPAYRLALSVRVGGDRLRYMLEEGQSELTMDLTARPEPGKVVQPDPDRSEEGRLFLFNYLDSGRGPAAAAVALGVAALLGALHALTPGHGKTLVAAYLAGSDAKVRHAFAVGSVLTITHTGIVFVLGLVALAAGSSISGHRVELWLHIFSAALVLGLGLFMLVRRVGVLRRPGHGHDHHHLPPVATGEDHAPAAQKALSGKGLVAVAAAGGMVPCPEAFGLLFASLTVGRVYAGLLILVAFSVGLGAVLFAITLSLILSKRAVSPRLERSRVVRYLPVVSALIVTGFGVALAISAARTF
jgi:ABC-type nickel/cobalt efflux system permease component RcnA